MQVFFAKNLKKVLKSIDKMKKRVYTKYCCKAKALYKYAKRGAAAGENYGKEPYIYRNA